MVYPNIIVAVCIFNNLLQATIASSFYFQKEGERGKKRKKEERIALGCIGGYPTPI